MLSQMSFFIVMLSAVMPLARENILNLDYWTLTTTVDLKKTILAKKIANSERERTMMNGTVRIQKM